MTYIGKNAYFNVLDDIVRKYNNTVHSSIKMKPKDLTDDSFVKYVEESNKKSLNLKQVIMSKFLSIKMCLSRVIHQIGPKKSLLLEKYKIQFLGLI